MATSRDGVEIAFTVHGAGEPAVVLVHGWAGDRSVWESQVGALSARYQVIAVDLGGHGESGLGRTDWNLPAYGDDVAVVVDALGLASVVLVGHSMGGDAALFAAVQLGDRVTGVVWVDAFRSLGHETPSTPDEVDAFVAPFHEDFPGAVARFARGLFPATADEALVDRVATGMAGARREVALSSLRYVLNREPPILAALQQLTAPIVAINPDTGAADADSLRDHGVEVIALPGVGHFPMLEVPEEFNALVASTLASFRQA